MPCAGPFWRHLCFASSKSWSRNGFVRNSIAPAFRHGDISMSGDKNNRHAHAALRQSLLEIQAAHSRQSNVENKATGNIRPLGAEKFRRGSKPLCVPHENRTPDAARNRRRQSQTRRTRQREADGRNRKASTAGKCMDQMPTPIVRDPPVNHVAKVHPLRAATRPARSSAVYEAATAITIERITPQSIIGTREMRS